jgi:hypothetical protein
MGRKAVPQGVDGRRLGYLRLAYRYREDSLDAALMAMVAQVLPSSTRIF